MVSNSENAILVPLLSQDGACIGVSIAQPQVITEMAQEVLIPVRSAISYIFSYLCLFYYI